MAYTMHCMRSPGTPPLLSRVLPMRPGVRPECQSPKRSFTVTSNAAASLRNVDAEGSTSSASILASVARLTPALAASSICVRPALRRIWRTVAAMRSLSVVIVTLYLPFVSICCYVEYTLHVLCVHLCIIYGIMGLTRADSGPAETERRLGILTTRVRDSQRQKVYDAEASVWLPAGRHTGLSRANWKSSPPEFQTLAEVQAFVDDVCATDFWQALAPESPTVGVKDGRGSRRGAASAELGEISMPRFTRRRWYTLHELAHVAQGCDETRAPHGPEYAAIYLALVREFLSPTEAKRLADAFKAYGVKAGGPAAVEVIDTIEVVEEPEADMLPANIGELINEEHLAAKTAYREAVTHAMRAGSMLCAMKDSLKHGEFGPWLRANCHFSQDTANVYMKIYKGRDELDSNSEHARNLSIRSALKAISPSKPKSAPVPKATPEPEPAADILAPLRAAKAVLERKDFCKQVIRTENPAEACELLLSVEALLSRRGDELEGKTED